MREMKKWLLSVRDRVELYQKRRTFVVDFAGAFSIFHYSPSDPSLVVLETFNSRANDILGQEFHFDIHDKKNKSLIYC